MSQEKVEGRTIGIDLGTTNSAVAVMEAGKATIIPNAEGGRTTPSITSVKDGEITVGLVAKNQAIINPQHTIRSIKRHMGDKDFKIDVDGKNYTPQEVSAMILGKLKRDAEAYLGGEVKNAIITVPAYFNDAQRQATKDAGTIAGLNVLRIINEPTAASLAYGLDKQEQDHTILVFDFGGGTFDVSVLEISDGVFEVKATSGDNHLGGDDVDDVLIDFIADDFKTNNNIDLRQDPAAHQRLKEAAEKAKIELSTKMQTTINIPYVTADSSGPKHVNIDLSRAKFEELIADILKRLEEPTKSAMKDAKVDKIDKIIFVGGSTRIPAVQNIVKAISNLEGDKSVNPDEAVAMGAAIQAGVLSGDVKDILLLDVIPLSVGIETLGGIFKSIVEKNSTIPTKKSEIFSTAADNQTAVTINVFQGERSMVGDNKNLGAFNLEGIPPAPRGIPQIEVTFDVDANGIMHVTAQDKGTGKEQSIKITGSSNLDDNEIERMKKEAEKNAEEDKKRAEEIETRNQAEQLVYQSKKQLEEFKDKINPDVKKKIEDQTKVLEEALKGDDHEKLKKELETMNTVLQEIGAQVYQEAAKAQASEEKKDDDVVDADLKEEKEDSK